MIMYQSLQGINATYLSQTLHTLTSMMTILPLDLHGQKTAGSSGSKGWNS